MNPLLFFSVIVTAGLICVSLSRVEGDVYYVSPAEQLSSCRRNSSCPSGKVCHTINYLAESTRHRFFSSDHVNVTLLFLCGVHNLTKNVNIQNLHSFVMKGGTETKENVIIDMLHQETVKPQFDTQSNKPSCTNIHFFNMSFQHELCDIFYR